MPECGKCGFQRLQRFGDYDEMLEPWCSACVRQHRSEYGPVLSDWVTKNPFTVLKDMGVPTAYRSYTFESFEKATEDQRRVYRAAESWTRDGEVGLFLCGPCGTGKTHLAVAALLALRGMGFNGRFVSMQELLMECRDSFRGDKGLREVLEKVCQRSVLLLDDLGAENPTPFARETVGLLIDRVYREEKALIVTSNYDLEALAERLDVRTVDRLIYLCLPVKLTGSSYRQKLAAQRKLAESTHFGCGVMKNPRL